MGSLLHGSLKPGKISRRGEPPHSIWEFSLKMRERGREKEREEVDTVGGRFPRNQFKKLV